ncbi:hybrid sensor histidine kinase/response regulator [Prevotella sp. E13-17]|uniref:hybrid sensor histidine kinase/response regulator n=1 Tax=Prevotella sp. E13-17 TaxID=2913616 RepID=UPI001EDA1FAA|nr:hybrid sensor histidine kinase/response regulator [Prevotella sp. E13-17]UKK49843.1 hybrid sensor histidine kinase/response regulator [Prevotella sp. E13-17]
MDQEGKFESQINRSDYKILIVDDVVSNVLLLKILLSNEKFQVCTANCGNMAVEQAKAEKPDLILLDVMMPDISGFDAAIILRKDPETKDIPIIFLTALNNPSDLVKGFQVGANDFLTKPFNKDELLVRVMHQIALVAAKRIIQKQNSDLQATIKNRDKMYSVIAHDLRSPMASIRMVLNLVMSAVTPEVIGPELFDLLDKANKESEDCHDLLDNLLKWTKSQTGRLNVVLQELDLNDIIPGVVEIYNMIASTKRIKLSYTGSKTPVVVLADNDMLKTIVRNFISNAIKFSPDESTIEITMKPDGEFAKISIKDHGVGISPDRLETLFHKGETTYGTDGEEGSGLGLQLCKDFATKIGGDVMVESVLGEGSTFSVFVPLKK